MPRNSPKITQLWQSWDSGAQTGTEAMLLTPVFAASSLLGGPHFSLHALGFRFGPVISH